MAETNVPQTSPHSEDTARHTGLAKYDLRGVLNAPVARQIMTLVGIAAAVAIGMAVVLWSRSPNYGLLYAGLAPKDASNIVQALQSDGVAYKLGSSGSTVFVPASQVASLRLSLAAQGLPQGTASSVKSDAKHSAFGMSNTAETIHNRHVLERNLAQTIASLKPVRSARVHLAIPKPSEFINANSHPSASVLVGLFPGRTLSHSQVSAITHLVATGVPNLDPSRVSVVDEQGELLTGQDTNSASAISDRRMRMTARIENVYDQRIENILTPIVGANHVRARVHADLDFSQGQKASEVFGKGKQALLSEQLKQRARTGTGPGGIPGALSNEPPVTTAQPTQAKPKAGARTVASAATRGAKASAASKPTVTSKSATRNFDVDHTITYVQNPAGNIARLSAAVVVDDRQVTGKHGKVKNIPLSNAEMANLTRLVKGVVGFDAARGDVVSVVNEPFQVPPPAGKPPVTHFWQQPGVMALIRQAAAVVAVLLLAFFLLRPLLKGILHPHKKDIEVVPEPRPVPLQVQNQPKVETVVGGPDEKNPSPLDAAAKAHYEQKVGVARRATNDDPRQVAQIVNNWVAADGA